VTLFLSVYERKGCRYKELIGAAPETGHSWVTSAP